MSAGRIPWARAKEIADRYGQEQVIIVTWDGEKTHVVTYGKTTEQSALAAKGGNFVKKALGWPDELCQDKPARQKRAEKRVRS